MLKYFLFTVTLLAQLSLFADTSQGEGLERKIWDDIANHKWSELESLTAPYFQNALFDGANNKEQFLKQAKISNVSTDYTLNNFIVTEGQDIMVVTYDIRLTETLKGNQLTSNASRLSVWHKNKDKWLWAAHALLIPEAPPSTTSKSTK